MIKTGMLFPWFDDKNWHIVFIINYLNDFLQTIYSEAKSKPVFMDKYVFNSLPT